MILPVYERFITDASGNVIPFAEVEIRDQSGALADLFLSADGTGPTTNPATANAEGKIKVFLVPGLYNVAATGPAGTVDFEKVLLHGNLADKDEDYVTRALPDITALSSLNLDALVDGQQFKMLRSFPGDPLDSVDLTWSPATPKAQHNGRDIYSPTVTPPADPNDEAQRSAYFLGNGETDTGGSGCLVATNRGSRRKIVILTTGQSNMVGSSLVSGGDQSNDYRVLAWNKRFNDAAAGGELTVASLGSAPFNGGGQQHIGFNAAKYIAKSLDTTVYVINIASGGESIERWISGDVDPKMWSAIQEHVPAALNAIGADHVDYIMWHQGEANRSDNVLYYRNRLREFKEQAEGQSWFKRGVSRMIVGGLAIGLPQSGTSGARDSMNLGLDLFAETDAEVAAIPTYDLETDSTGIHFTDESIAEIGERYGKASTYIGQYSSRISPSRVIDGNVFFVIDPNDPDGFPTIESFLHFAGTLSLTPNARVDVLIRAGKYTADISPRLSFDGTFFRFYGELSDPFSAPVKADFSPDGAPDSVADLSMLRSKYLTEIEISGNVGLVLGGGTCGFWENILFSNPSPSLGSAAVRSSDPNLFTPNGGRILLTNCAFHGWDGTGNYLVDASGGASITMNSCIASHCTRGVRCINARVSTQRSLYAHCGRAVEAIKFAFIDAFELELHSPSETSYVASISGVIYAGGADNNTSVSVANEGKVLV